MTRSAARGRGGTTGFTVIEVLVVLGIIAVLMAILLPVMEKVRHRGYIQACASNLRSIGQAMAVYANENHGHYPRTTYVPDAPVSYGSGVASPDPFASGAISPNDVSTAVFLLLRSQKLPYAIFICPYNDVFVYEIDRGDSQSRSNFTDYRKNFGYSIANPYPDDAAVRAGYKWTATMPPDFALLADKNPGIDTDNTTDDATAALPGAPEQIMSKARSENHEKDGQNVLYADGHVAWQLNVTCGVSQDNIFTTRGNQLDASPVDKNDSVLLPTDDPK